MTTTTALDRDVLLALCERGFVPQEHWYNRDTSAAQRQLGECYALLKAGCEFTVHTERDTHWVTVTYRGFDFFEGTYDGMGSLDDERFYVPTAERLDRSPGRDWY
jgi:hypothetical protein